MKRILTILSIFLAIFVGTLNANNIRITGKPRLVNKNASAHTVRVSIPLAWDNSWKSPVLANWDAAWVFVKFRPAGTDWHHMYIDTNNVHTAVGNVPLSVKVGSSAVSLNDESGLKTVNRGMGVFIYRTNDGKGSVIVDSISLLWKYIDQDIQDDDIVSIRAYAIEMVYVPQSAYYWGDGTANNRAISLGTKAGEIIMGSSVFNTPGGRLPVFKNLGAITFPTGSYNTVGNGSNGVPVGWYAEESKSTGARLYKNTPWNYSYWRPALNAYADKGPGVGGYGYHTMTSPTGNHIFIISMPSPYKATSSYFSYWHTPYRPQRYQLSASTDSVSWTTLFGDINAPDNGSIPELTNIYNSIPLAKQAAYKYYRYDFKTSAGNYFILNAVGLCDTTPSGYPENGYYYSNFQYKGAMPLKWVAGNITSSETYPNGYEAFYMMKYELSQHGYVDFLNTLDVGQQRARIYITGVDPISGTEGFYYFTGTATPPTHPRNYIMLRKKKANLPAEYHCFQNSSRDVDDYSQQGGNIAMSLMNWVDNTAYLCWSGLRPLTELEFEKACKGPKASTLGMYAWGTANVVGHTGVGTYGIYTGDEMVTPSNANYITQAANGIFPARVGCLATPTSNRADAGAGYYGALNLSDNVSEFYVNCETIQGLAFDGSHGSGILDGNGEAQMATWPGTDGQGTGFKGNIRGDGVVDVRGTVACRDWTNHTNSGGYALGRYAWVGCRGGRTAPK